MSFIGQPIVKLIADNLVRITGVQLDNDLFTTGLISLFENTAAVAPPPDIRLPDDFKPRDYDLPDAAAKVSLQDSVECWFVYTSPGAVLAPIQVVKTGTTPLDFLITLTDTAT